MRSARRERKGSLEMAAVNSAARCVMDSHFEGQQNGTVDRLKKLYPAVNEEKSPLPRAWSPKEKYNLIGLSQNNLRVHYKGERESMIFKVFIVFSWLLSPRFVVSSPWTRCHRPWGSCEPCEWTKRSADRDIYGVNAAPALLLSSCVWMNY